ncbi:translation machinery-associated protein 16 [Microdochium nivale]|nr:translation machinery-associated protein 16 [Microdochium nivale]
MTRTTFDKARKAIAKKKGPVQALHQYSRDSKRLHRAQVRDVRLEKLASTRRKTDRPHIERASFFQEAVRQNEGKPFDLETIQELIKGFVHQFDEELAEIKQARRPGRPASTREDLLKVKIANLETEYQNGFLLPVLNDEAEVAIFDRWDGHWAYLTQMKWMRVSVEGKVQPSSFPPKGEH